jgi:hypothetical protein
MLQRVVEKRSGDRPLAAAVSGVTGGNHIFYAIIGQANSPLRQRCCAATLAAALYPLHTVYPQSRISIGRCLLLFFSEIRGAKFSENFKLRGRRQPTRVRNAQDRESGNQIGFRVGNIAWFKLKHCCPLGTPTWQKRRVFLQNLSTRNRPRNVVLSVRLVLSALHYLTHIPRQESQPTSPGEKRDSLRCP